MLGTKVPEAGSYLLIGTSSKPDCRGHSLSEGVYLYRLFLLAFAHLCNKKILLPPLPSGPWVSDGPKEGHPAQSREQSSGRKKSAERMGERGHTSSGFQCAPEMALEEALEMIAFELPII